MRVVRSAEAQVRLEVAAWVFRNREQIEARLDEEPLHGLHPAAVHAVRCAYCERAMRELCRGDWGPYFRELDQVIADRTMEKGEVLPHMCIRDGCDPIHIVYSLTHPKAPGDNLTFEQADKLLDEGKALPEVKFKQKVDHKHYRKGRKVIYGNEKAGGKRSLAFKYDDYQQFKEHIEDGHFDDAYQMARSRMLDSLGIWDADAELEVSQGRMEMDVVEWRRYQYELADELAHEVVKKLAKRVHTRTGGRGEGPRFRPAYAKWYPEDVPDAHHPVPEGNDVVAKQQVMTKAYARVRQDLKLPEVKQPEHRPRVLMTGENWDRSTTDAESTQAEAVAAAVPKWEAHQKVVATHAESTKAALPETVRAQGPAEVKQNPRKGIKLGSKKDPQPPAVKKARQRIRNSARKPKPKSKGLPEALVPGSVPYDPLNHVAYAEFSNGRKMQGYVLNRGASKNWFITGRHDIGEVNGMTAAVDGMKDWSSDGGGQTIVIRQGKHDPVKCRVLEARSNGVTDRVALLLEGLPDVPAIRYAHQVNCHEAVLMVFWGPLNKGEEPRWCQAHGNATAVTGDLVTYSISTLPGHCRATVFSASGKIIGGHYHPGVHVGNGKYPACDRDLTDLGPGWKKEYHPPPTGPNLLAMSPPALPQGESHLTSLGRHPDYYVREEKHKIWGLRTDATVQPAYQAEYFVAKPSTRMLHDEIQKFGDPSDFKVDMARLEKAYAAMVLLEEDAKWPFSHEMMKGAYGADKFLENALKMDLGTTSAGAEALASTHHELLCDVGAGDSAEGARICAQQAHDLYLYLSGERRDREWNEAMDDIKIMCQCWVVQGKKDGYKLKKLYVGRSIQAPCFTFKLFWRTLFGENGDHWVARDDRVRAGANMDHPIKGSRVEKYARAMACVGLDETAFDRYIPREFMHCFFVYMNEMCGFGVPEQVLNWIEKCTVDSYLLLSTGDLFQKHRGNPSGFPDTLRLNSVVQILSWCYMVQFLPQASEWTAQDIFNFFEEDVYLEVCGDDSRASCLTERACEVLGSNTNFQPLLEVFGRVLPWSVKIEGMVNFTADDMALPFAQRADRFPPLVARNLTVIDGYLWQPLWNLDRCSRTYMSMGTQAEYVGTGRSDEEEDMAATGTMMCLRNHIYWHTRGTHYSPLIQSFIDNGWLDLPLYSACMRVVAESYAYGALMCSRL
jgi:hypothetical protein